MRQAANSVMNKFQYKKINKRIENYHNFTDEKLITDYFTNHELNIIGELFKRYTHLVFGVCLKYLQDEEKSKDAVMEIFESLIEKLKTHKVLDFKKWLYSVSKNHCLMSLRAEAANIKMKEKRPISTITFVMTNCGKVEQYDIIYFFFAQIVLKRRISVKNPDQRSGLLLKKKPF